MSNNPNQHEASSQQPVSEKSANVDMLLDPAPDPSNEEMKEFEAHGVKRHLVGKEAYMLSFCALLFSTFQLAVAADLLPLSSLVVRSLHVSFLILLAFILYPTFKQKKLNKVAWYDWIFAAVGFGIGFYHWVFEAQVIQNAGEPNTFEVIIGSVIVILVFEGTRRIMGWALPIVCGLFLAYGLLGQYLPAPLAHRGYDYSAIISQLYLGTDGIYGIPILVSATYIFLFILFGAFLEHAGMIRLFNAIALGFVGHAQGGPAKVAVVSSGFMGMISGSGVANVLTVGQFTIPLMKRFGYSSVFAGAVEATASMGGQIMPPVMGAVAFIMAETLHLPYAEIVKAALIPALLYYLTAFLMVHFEAGRARLTGLPKEQCPNPWKHIQESWYLLLPLAVLVYMLFHGFTPKFAGMMGLCLTAILILGMAIAARINAVAFRYVFWVGMGLAAASFFKWGVQPVLGVIVLLSVICLFIQGGSKTLHTLYNSLIDGAQQALPVGLACAIVGVIVGVLLLTGAATSFAAVVLRVGEQNLFLSLFLTMLVCLVLGMGIPTIPNYIITSSIAAPALLKLGVPLLVSHMFVFYFGIMADLTPPVALAAFAAASIAKEAPMKIGIKATQIAIAGFVIPFIAVYDNALMLQGAWTFAGAAYIVFKCILAIVLWCGFIVGYLFNPLSLGQRFFSVVAAAMLIAAVPITDQIGFGMTVILVVWSLWSEHHERKSAQNNS